jgi:ABC-type lipoprotein release transport system permease subunit
LENTTTRFDKKITRGKALQSTPSHEAVMGEGLARTLKADVGDELVIVSQAADGSIANDLYTIVGLVSSGDGIADRTALYLHLSDAQALLVLEERVHEIAIVVDDLEDVDETVAAVAETIERPELEVVPWPVFAKSFYNAMQADRRGTWISLFVIMLVVSVGVLNTVLMTVLERTREYGVLRAVGTAPGQVFRMVLIEVMIMACAGIVIGCGIAYAANYALSIEGIPLPTPISYGGIVFDRLFTMINAQSFYIPAVCVLVSAFLTSIFPGRKAARIAPAKAMRTV